MKILKAFTFAGLMAASLASLAAQPVIDLGKGAKLNPGVYGEVKLGKSKPALVYPEPKTVVIYTHPVKKPEPVYMHVPPEQAQHWEKYCRDYRVCDRPVYFVKSREYETGYVPPKVKKAAKSSAAPAGQSKHGDSSRNGSGDGSGDGTGRKKSTATGQSGGGGGGKGDGSGGGHGKHKNNKNAGGGGQGGGNGDGSGGGTGKNNSSRQ